VGDFGARPPGRGLSDLGHAMDKGPFAVRSQRPIVWTLFTSSAQSFGYGPDPPDTTYSMMKPSSRRPNYSPIVVHISLNADPVNGPMELGRSTAPVAF
jgi:hypothetical protein